MGKQRAATSESMILSEPDHLTAGIDFETSYQALAQPVYLINEDGYILKANTAATDFWGACPQYGKERWCGTTAWCNEDGAEIADWREQPVSKLSQQPFTGNLPVFIRNGQGIVQKYSLSCFRLPLKEKLMVVHLQADTSPTGSSDSRQHLLSAIVASSDDAIISKNLDGIILSWNAGAQRIFGYKEHEIIGKPINILIPEMLQDEEKLIIRNIKAGNKIEHFQTIRLSKDGREIPLSITVSPVKDESGKIIGASKIARDISDELKKQREIRLYAQRLEFLNAIGKAISEKLEVNVILQRVTDATTDITGAAFGAFFYNVTDDNGESYMLYALSGAPRASFDRLGMPRNTRLFSTTFSGQGIVRSDDITRDERYGHNSPFAGMPKGHLPVVSYLAVPVVSAGGSVIGGLFFGHPEASRFTAEHETLVATVATQAAVAIDNSRLFEEVKSANNKKDEFLALASHELKTPLTTIKGYLQLIDRYESHPVSKLFVDKSLRQAEKLNKLIAELLDISKIESGQLQFDFEHFDLLQLLYEVVDTFKYTDTRHQISIEAEGLAAMVYADRQRMEQVIINLLTNAIKYSPHADQVKVYCLSNEAEVIVKIADEGIGLEQDDLLRVFDRFYRASGNGTIGGLGLGLYLTKQIIDRHNGQIKVESEKGRGATFSFSLPAAGVAPLH